MKFVVEVGASSLSPLVTAIRLLVGSLEGAVEVVPGDAEANCTFVPFEGGLPDALTALSMGTAAAVLVRLGTGPSSCSILLCRPHFAGDGLGLWYGVVDGLSRRSVASVRTLRGVSELTFASIAVEDTLDLETVGEISTLTFPWGHWRLVEAAVADTGDFGTAQPRAGPALRRLEKSV